MTTTSPAMELVLALYGLQSRLLKKIDQRLSTHGISFTEFMVLYQLYLAPQQTMRRIDLAESVGLSASGVTRLLAPMEKIKLVEKEVNPRDARVSLVKLSGTGKQVFDDALVSFRESAEFQLQSLDAGQVEKFLQFINLVR